MKNKKFLFDTNALCAFTQETDDGYQAINAQVASLEL